MENGQKDKEEVPSSTFSVLPAQPPNGMRRTFENSGITFGSYTAKTVTVYKEGDLHFAGVRVPVSKQRYTTIANLMDDLNRIIYLPYGVRNISTSMGGTVINSLDQLEHLGQYIASSSNPPKKVDLDKIKEKFSATQRREPLRLTAGGDSVYMSSSTPNALPRTKFTYKIDDTPSAVQLFFVLNGKGKFYRTTISQTKVPTMHMLLEELSTSLEIAIHRLYAPGGKLITSVEEILLLGAPRIIACPRHERPIFNDASKELEEKIRQMHPSKYAPRQIYMRTETKSSGGSVAAVTSASSSDNSIEKRKPAPSQNNRLLIRKYPVENGVSNAKHSTITTSYVPKSYATKARKIAPTVSAANAISRKSQSKEISRNSKNEDESAVSSATSTGPIDSGTGTSINSQQSDRPASMTEKKAQMIRDELRANLSNQNRQSSSENYSEEDMIQEEESDYEHIGRGIQSGTSEEEIDSRVGTQDNASRRSGSHQSTVRQTPSTPGSEKPSNHSRTASIQRTRTVSRENTPYQETPSRQSTAASRPVSSQYLKSKSASLSRETSASTAIQEASDEGLEDVKEENISEEKDDVSIRSPAAETPDTRLPTAESRPSTAGSQKSFASDSSKAFSRMSNYSDMEVILPSDDELDVYRGADTPERERIDRAATKVTRFMRRYAAEKKKVKFEAELQEYSIEILLGERYGLDFDTRLFIILHGEEESSEKLYIAKTDWLLSPMNTYESSQWIIQTMKVKKLGILKSIVLGHEQEGYGAGTFIDRVVITETDTDRCFQFQISKWFDSGQVDGLIERDIGLSGYMYWDTPDHKQYKLTQGRWEIRLHSVLSAIGGTTSNVIITAFGEHDSSSHKIVNKNLLNNPAELRYIQLDFGTTIGEIRKLRVELEEAGDKPFYYLDRVEALDLDSKQCCVIMVNGWLHTKQTPGFEYWQPFREAPFFAKDYFTSSVKTYHGSVVFSDKTLIDAEKDQIWLRYIHADEGNGDVRAESSGAFPVIPVVGENGEIEYKFKVDFVTQNNNMTIRVDPTLTKLGYDLMDGMDVLQEVMDSVLKNKEHIVFGQELFIDHITTFYGEHCPYYTIYATSGVVADEDLNENPFFKHLAATVFPANPTKRQLHESEDLQEDEMANWELTMILDNLKPGTPIIPTVVLVANDRRTFEMECMMANPNPIPIGWTIKYNLTAPNFGNPRKCRISCEETNDDTYTNVNKIFLTENKTKTHVFIKEQESELEGYDTHEFECHYPDDGGRHSVEYLITMRTESGSGEFRPYINVIGKNGDTGYRAFTANKPFVVKELSTNAINLGDLVSVEVWAKTGKPENWRGTLEVAFLSQLYESNIIEISKNGQIAQSPLILVEREGIEDEEEDGHGLETEEEYEYDEEERYY
ncbi:hypothetical protein L5515_001719 [Caenorhabditis briggsae]|uniref:Doublecortin domain-containing protein n=2 Tax=Caenorhabditis briggsae TaxID=6238 RepID=A0AAE9J3B3_CAEBR|nr:hypothetical protein L5515_001719 [Caenorhabditis briggsae]